ncbi:MULTISPECIES: MBL fold metallo-hydrolase [Thiomicrorhabdus]|uniref:MBL fold metallo-hydrolase n=1 Tax=Thiomicrorhabdus heinhorstiae TaxID=2748010 RepID=A0ABS0BTG9_9GAMM|nr:MULTISPECIES: MBL fold metallo-hydrolase [Thiomicrorhabdus]MBF6057142.1 MBL fold metallo-hydrolase [Thiomicrorhabdus heinhorstiae]
MNRRDFFKSAFSMGVGLVGASALKPLYANDEMKEFRGPDVPDVDAIKVSERCYSIPAMGPHPTPENFGMFSNPGFIVTSEGVVVVDTGSSVQIGEMILRQIKKVTDKPVVKVINTHFHGDHWLGNHAFVEANPNVEILSHQDCITTLKNGADKFWFDFMQSNTNNKITGTVITLPNKTFAGGEEFTLGDTTFKIHHFGKVHTSSDIAVEVKNDKTIFMGDMVMRRVANMEDGSYLGSIKALDAVSKMDLKNIIPMHGTPDDMKLILEGKEFMETIYNNVAELYDEGLSDFEMKPIISEKPFMQNVASKWPGYDSAIGKFIVVAIKEVEQNMF